MLSFLIPSRNEKYLEQTIKNVLENCRGEIEVLVALDGWLPDPQIVTNDPRVIFYHEPESIGQRQSINKLAKLAKGDFICKLDAHCAIDEGFNVKITADFEDDWMVVPRMFNLDVSTFKPKLRKRTDYMYIGYNDKAQLRSLYYEGEEYRKQHRKPTLIDDVMTCMGCCWVFKTKRFLELGGCDETMGSWGSQGIEMSCKSWLTGGSVKVNKKTWFSHWFRGSDGGFPYPMTQEQVDKARNRAEELFIKNKYGVRDFKWLMNKFNMTDEVTELNNKFYKHIHLKRHEPNWKGIRILKMPTDLLLYSEVIDEAKPNFIIECGTKFGGLALYLQDMLDLRGGGRVVTIDKYPQDDLVKDPRITYIHGSSTDKKVLNEVGKLLSPESRVMVILDSDHSRTHVKWELHYWSRFVSKGQYLVVEDCYNYRDLSVLYGPGEARDWFLSKRKDFKQTNLDQKYIIGYCRGGWLKKI